jgi:ferredoxin
MAVHAVAAGRTAAQCADRFLRGEPPRADPRPFDSVVGRLEEGEMREFLRAASADARTAPASPAAGFSEAEARREAARCLRCDCRKARGCLLRKFADECGARQNRYRGRGRAPVRIVAQHAEVVYEPGKCIRCGLCVAICERAREPLGLTFIGRGFDVQVGAPFGESMDRALTAAAAECVAACPTGALAFRDGAGGLREA